MKSFYAGKSLFTWAGAKVNRTITLMCKLRVHQDVDYNNLMIFGMSPKHISDILSQEKPSNDELAALVSREDKEEQFDRCLSEERLNREFASTCLDVDKAWAKLQKLSTQFGSEDFYNDEDMEYDEEYYEAYHEDADDYEVLDDDYYEEYDDDEDSDKIEDNACQGH